MSEKTISESKEAIIESIKYKLNSLSMLSVKIDKEIGLVNGFGYEIQASDFIHQFSLLSVEIQELFLLVGKLQGVQVTEKNLFQSKT